jgi:DNA-binding transcriptional LysR family regulator
MFTCGHTHRPHERPRRPDGDRFSVYGNLPAGIHLVAQDQHAPRTAHRNLDGARAIVRDGCAIGAVPHFACQRFSEHGGCVKVNRGTRPRLADALGVWL